MNADQKCRNIDKKVIYLHYDLFDYFPNSYCLSSDLYQYSYQQSLNSMENTETTSHDV